MLRLVRRLSLIAAVCVVLLASLWVVRRYTFRSSAEIEPILVPGAELSPTVSPEPLGAEPPPTPEPTATQELRSLNDLSQGNFIGTLNLIIPVVGVRSEQLLDTFDEARSEGRVHDAIDIAAPAGTPVVAAADGQILKLFQSERGGTTIYQLSSNRKLVFYYAHLQQYAPNLTEGMFVRQGDVLAYVGDTGNAVAGNYHLHFSINIVSDPKRYWEGISINPYPLLHR